MDPLNSLSGDLATCLIIGFFLSSLVVTFEVQESIFSLCQVDFDDNNCLLLWSVSPKFYKIVISISFYISEGKTWGVLHFFYKIAQIGSNASGMHARSLSLPLRVEPCALHQICMGEHPQSVCVYADPSTLPYRR